MTAPSSANLSGRLLCALIEAPTELWSGWSERDHAEMLRHQLATALVVELEELARCSRITEAEAGQIVAESGCVTFGDALSSTVATAPLLRLVKTYAKSVMGSEGGLPVDVARILYVASLRHGQRRKLSGITSLDDVAIERQARRCLTCGWLAEDVRDLLRLAP